ncbi:hypothetical protein C7375_1361 [Frischella perrara]|uniref:DUF2931 domain-containing protein n=1 Tax=Frischella perrara TaxID=1267021 RepID=A0A0A7S1Z4_FRIPE|nr:DUF2931 family protein [Frischella perrara]AJA44847.1 protein of unknown function (DUF2931) [Frischella perrara]PWV57675.1 hypothetical protein C7375_1361 [Frischella perrara]
MLKLLISTLCLMLLISGCQSPIKSKPIDPNLPKMPYSKWYISGRHPHYFPATVTSTMIRTQSNKYKIIDIVARDNQNYKTPGQWQTGFGFSHLPVYSDLPEEFFICWSSFADQTFYRTKLVMPLWARQEMVKAHHYYSEAFNKNKIGYNDTIIIGFAPGGSVTGWVTGNPQKDSEAIEFGKGVTERIPQGSDVCPNPYPDGKIPEITDEAKAWLKKHGMPKEWQEKYNNVTMGQYLKLKNPARF